MSATTESPYSVTFRTKGGTLITVRGDDHDELTTRLALASVPVGPDEGTLLEMIGSIDGALSGGAASSGTHHGEHEATQQTQRSLNPPCPDCGGETIVKNGSGTKGPWEAYFCKDGRGHSVRDAKTGNLWPKRS